MGYAAEAMASQVDRNFEAFRKLLPDLMCTHAGKFAVLSNEAVVEFFDSFADAVRYGDAKFGAGNFSVQEVTSPNINLGFHSYALHRATA